MRCASRACISSSSFCPMRSTAFCGMPPGCAATMRRPISCGGSYEVPEDQCSPNWREPLPDGRGSHWSSPHSKPSPDREGAVACHDEGCLMNPPSDFPGVLSAEVEDIRARREALFPRQQPLAAAPAPTPPHPYIEAHRIRPRGVAFSGGGIRSATFNLGVLQGLAELGLLPFIDYLSTVSGGGYIGSWLHALIRNKYSGDPGAPQPDLDPSRVPGESEQDYITFLRKYSNYLAPQLGLFSPDFWTIGAVWIRNMLLNLQILIPFLVGVVLTVLMSGILQQRFGEDLESGVARSLWVLALAAAVTIVGVNLRQIVFAQFPDLIPRVKPPDLSGRGMVGFATLCIMFASYILGAFRFDPDPTVAGILLSVLFFMLQWLGGFRLCYRARHQGASGWPLLIAIPLVSAAFTSALLWCVWKLTGTWVNPDVGWLRIAVGPPMILVVWMCGTTLQIQTTRIM